MIRIVVSNVSFSCLNELFCWEVMLLRVMVVEVGIFIELMVVCMSVEVLFVLLVFGMIVSVVLCSFLIVVMFEGLFIVVMVVMFDRGMLFFSVGIEKVLSFVWVVGFVGLLM